MKRLIIKLLDMAGLVTAGRHGVVVARLRQAETRAKELGKLVDHLREETRALKASAGDAAKQIKLLERDVQHHAELAESGRAEADKRRRAFEKQGQELAKLQAHVDRLRTENAELEAMRKRIADAEHALGMAREHLMAVDVKLDILEGAANVLDTRTRAVIAEQAGEASPIRT